MNKYDEIWQRHVAESRKEATAPAKQALRRLNKLKAEGLSDSERARREHYMAFHASLLNALNEFYDKCLDEYPESKQQARDLIDATVAGYHAILESQFQKFGIIRPKQ